MRLNRRLGCMRRQVYKEIYLVVAGKINGGVLQITFRNQGIGKYKKN